MKDERTTQIGIDDEHINGIRRVLHREDDFLPIAVISNNYSHINNSHGDNNLMNRKIIKRHLATTNTTTTATNVTQQGNVPMSLLDYKQKSVQSHETLPIQLRKIATTNQHFSKSQGWNFLNFDYYRIY